MILHVMILSTVHITAHACEYHLQGVLTHERLWEMQAARRQVVIGVATSLNQPMKKANLNQTAIVKAPKDQAAMGEVHFG